MGRKLRVDTFHFSSGVVTEEESDEEGSQENEGEDGQPKLLAPVPVPSQPIKEALVQTKKTKLLQKCASETLQAQSEEAKRLVGSWG